VIQPLKIGCELVVRKADPAPVDQLKLVQMRQIPARKGRVDRLRKLLEGMRRAHDHDPPRRRIEIPFPATDQIHPNPQPRPRHRPRRLPKPQTGL